jgi:hypothetical protein
MSNQWISPPPPSATCPENFEDAGGGTCVVQCPRDPGYTFLRQGGSANGYRCVWEGDPTISVPLVGLAPVVIEEDDPYSGRASFWMTDAAGPFRTEYTRARDAMATAYAAIGRSKLLSDSFRQLQLAENARAEAPTAYQAARIAYYTLLKGPAWMAEEKARIAAADVAPEVAKYRASVDAIAVRTQEQQKTIDIVQGIKDKVLSLKDDVKYSVNTFSDQLEKVKIQLAMESRARPQADGSSSWEWVDLALNLLLIGALLYAIVMIVRRMYATPRPSLIIQTPTYTRPSV